MPAATSGRCLSMKKICKYCGNAYDGDPGSSACPDCVAARKLTTIATRTCSICGATFRAGPSSKFCPVCLAERKKEQAARRRRTGTLRPLGSTDRCQVCGADYIVKSGRQKYCPACSAEAIREKDRQQSRKWNAENTTPEDRKAIRKAASAPVACVVCGKMFIPTDSAKTCSPECSQKNNQKRFAAWEKENREARNAYQRQRVKAKVDAMTPEEYKAYREEVNKRWRENYAARQAKKK